MTEIVHGAMAAGAVGFARPWMFSQPHQQRRIDSELWGRLSELRRDCRGDGRARIGHVSNRDLAQGEQLVPDLDLARMAQNIEQVRPPRHACDIQLPSHPDDWRRLLATAETLNAELDAKLRYQTFCGRWG